MQVLRELGDIGISLPSSIPIDNFIKTNKEGKVGLWVNVRTLVRNLIHTQAAADLANLTPDVLAVDIMAEMNILMTTMAQGEVDLTFYATDQSDINRKFKQAFLNTPTTPKQKKSHRLAQEALAIIFERTGETIKKQKIKLDGDNSLTAFMLTHQPLDLLSHNNFKSIVLLESHTGKMKGRRTWSTKLRAKDTELMPFCEFTLQVFGDGDTFKPHNTPIRKEVHRIAELGFWTPTTTMSKVISDLNRHGSPDLLPLLRLIANSKI